MVGAIEPSTARDEVPAIFQRDPRTLDAGELTRTPHDASAAIAGLGTDVAFNAVAAMSELRHEIFIDTAGALISQAFAFSKATATSSRRPATATRKPTIRSVIGGASNASLTVRATS